MFSFSFLHKFNSFCIFNNVWNFEILFAFLKTIHDFKEITFVKKNVQNSNSSSHGMENVSNFQKLCNVFEIIFLDFENYVCFEKLGISKLFAIF